MARIVLISMYEVNYLGTRLLSAYLRSKGHFAHNIFFKDFKWEIREQPLDEHSGYQILANGLIVGAEFDSKPCTSIELELLAKQVATLKPDIIGLSARSPLKWTAKEIITNLRNTNGSSLYVAGGYGPTLEPEEFLEMGFDIVIRGDGEESLLELADCIDRKADWREVSNICYLNNRQLQINHLASQEKNISKYPVATHGDCHCSFIDDNQLHPFIDPMGMPYMAQSEQKAYSTFITRGCAGKCTYCSGGYAVAEYRKDGVKSYKCRIRELDDVLQELENIDKTRFSYVAFVDECYTLTNEETRYFFKEYAKRVKLPFGLFLNYRKMIEEPELFKLIVESGLDSTGTGIQTGSEQFARQYYRRNGNNNVYREYITLLFESFIHNKIQFIQGNCYETEEDFRNTLDFIKSLPFDPLDASRTLLNVIRLQLFPKAPLLEIAPKVLANPMPAKEWWRRGLLMEMRRWATDEEMDEALNSPKFRNDPGALKSHLNKIIQAVQLRAMEAIVRRLSGKNTLIFGAGKIFRQNKPFLDLHGVNPAAIIVDEPFLDSLPTQIYGIPVCSPAMAFDRVEKPQVLVCAENASTICRHLMKNFGMIADNLHPCVSFTPLVK